MIQLKNLFLATILFTCLTANAQARQEKELSLVEIEAAMKTDERLIVCNSPPIGVYTVKCRTGS